MAKNEKISTLNFKVQLDENNVPSAIEWSSSDNGEYGECNAALISLWDAREENTMKIDLWTKEMRIDEMKRFFHQTLHTMADTFERATNEEEAAQALREFSRDFGERMGVVQKE